MAESAQKKKSSKIVAKTPVRKKVPKVKDKIDVPLIYFCSFCGKPSNFAKRLIAGPNGIFICDECLEVCVKILMEEDRKDWQERLTSILAKKQKKVEKWTKRKVKKDKT